MHYLDGGLDNLLLDIPPTIEGALQVAVDKHLMTTEEAELCRADYYRVFDGLEDPLELPGSWGERGVDTIHFDVV